MLKRAVSLFEITVGRVEHLRVAVLVVRTDEVLGLAGGGGAVPVPPAVVLVRKPARPHLTTVDILLRGAAVRGGGGGGGVLAVRVALVTHRTAGTVGEVGIVTAVVQQVEHLGVSLLIIRADVVPRLQARLTAPVPPAAFLSVILVK